MQLLQRASLFVALYLFASAAAAHAECAWVLWQEINATELGGRAGLTNNREWKIMGAVSGGELPCEQFRRTAIQRFQQEWRGKVMKTEHGEISLTETPSGGTVKMQNGPPPTFLLQTYTYECLPDTIDPRGPKTK